MLTFPTALLVPSSLSAEIVGASVSGGESLSGIPQDGFKTGGGHWEFKLGEVTLWGSPGTLALKRKVWEAIAANGDNGATPFIVPVCDRLRQPFAASQVKKGSGVGNSDDSKFADGALWPAEYITSTLLQNAALRATVVQLTCLGGVAPTGGEHFTLWGVKYGQRLHRITQVSTIGGGYQCVIRPPLREPYASGTSVDFDNPRCQMSLVTPAGAILEALRFGKSPAVTFRENFLPPGS